MVFSSRRIDRFKNLLNSKRLLAARLKNAGHDVSNEICDVVLVGVRSQYETIIKTETLTHERLEARL